MVFWRAISNSIAPKPRHFFFRPRPKAEDEKKMPRLRGYTVGYSPTKHHIYNIYPNFLHAALYTNSSFWSPATGGTLLFIARENTI